MSTSNYSTEPRNCDVVMKGGITSGVVYPKAISELAKKFQLRNIGGTSAGAIAAAIAAAAQYRAITKRDRSSFEELEKLPVFLGGTNQTGQTNLFTFFQPQKRTKALFYTLTGALEAKGAASAIGGIFLRAVRHYPFWIAVGMLPGIALGWLALTDGRGPLAIASIILGVGLIFVGAIAGVVGAILLHFGKRIPANCFGFCTGLSTNGNDDAAKGPSAPGQALTLWLTKYINELAGLGPDDDPLTFGQLWWPDLPRGSVGAEDERAIRLEMFTTCLSLGRPFRVPFRKEKTVRENAWYFLEAEFARFFPPSVVRWLAKNPRDVSRDANAPGSEYLPMPAPWNLPVVVATRLSLSFPILLSAVPLFARKFDLGVHGESDHIAEQDPAMSSSSGCEMSRCWFSDGGICSNFPLHFFDAPVPAWPTFGINLVEQDVASSGTSANPWMPPSNNAGIHDRWASVGETGGVRALFGFIGAIISTMQNWSDNTLSRMPGYRDRIAHVALTKEEGGLNLQMPASRIEHLSRLGKAAAVEFTRRFAEPREAPMNWENHRWIRLRSMLASVVEMATTIDHRCAHPAAGDEPYDLWLETMAVGDAPSYRWPNKTQQALALKTLRILRDLARQWEGEDPGDGAPRPRPELRPRPRT
jgi:predicted acylesterase/phospholipase RssA